MEKRHPDAPLHGIQPPHCVSSVIQGTLRSFVFIYNAVKEAAHPHTLGSFAFINNAM